VLLSTQRKLQCLLQGIDEAAQYQLARVEGAVAQSQFLVRNGFGGAWQVVGDLRTSSMAFIKMRLTTSLRRVSGFTVEQYQDCTCRKLKTLLGLFICKFSNFVIAIP